MYARATEAIGWPCQITLYATQPANREYGRCSSYATGRSNEPIASDLDCRRHPLRVLRQEGRICRRTRNAVSIDEALCARCRAHWPGAVEPKGQERRPSPLTAGQPSSQPAAAAATKHPASWRSLGRAPPFHPLRLAAALPPALLDPVDLNHGRHHWIASACHRMPRLPGTGHSRRTAATACLHLAFRMAVPVNTAACLGGC